MVWRAVAEREARDPQEAAGVVSTYDSVSVAEARAVLAHGIVRRVPLLTLTGKVGSGIGEALQSLHERFAGGFDLAFPSRPPGSIAELAVPVLRLLGRPFVDAPAAKLMAALCEALAARQGGRPAALLLDDAEQLSDALLEALAVFGPPAGSDEAPVSVVLAGRPELLARLESPRLSALRRGLTIDVHLNVPAPASASEPEVEPEPPRPVPVARVRPAASRAVLSAVLVGCLCAATTLYLDEQAKLMRTLAAAPPRQFVPLAAPRQNALAALVVPRTADAALPRRPPADADEPGAAEARRLVVAFQRAIADGDGEAIRSLLAADVRYNGVTGIDAALDDQVWLGRGADRPRFAPPNAVRRDGETLVVEAPFHVPYRDVAGVPGEVAGRARWRLDRTGSRLVIVQVDYDVLPTASAGDG